MSDNAPYRTLLAITTAVTMTAAVMLTGCGSMTYADQTTVAEPCDAAGAAVIDDGFYRIELSSFNGGGGNAVALDTKNGTFRPGCALPTARSDDSEGQQFLLTKRGEGIYTIRNANTNQNVKIMTGLTIVGNEASKGLADDGSDAVDVELWKIVETSGGDIMLVPFLLTTSLFEQITVDSFGTGTDLARPWVFIKTQVGISESDVALSLCEAEYTGEPIRPEVTVTKAGRLLAEDKDYVVVYENNREIGTASVRVSGIGEYAGTCAKEFEITPIDISRGGDMRITPSETAVIGGTDESGMAFYTYTGAPLTPRVEVTFNGNTLTEDVDYTVTFRDNIYPGAAAVDITGTGIYRGSFHRAFVIGGVETEIDQTRTYTFAPKSHGTDRLSVKDGGITAGSVLDTSAASDEEKEKFGFFANEDGTYRIISMRSGFCVEDIAGSVRLGEYDGKAGQNWVVRKNRDDTFTFENAGTGQVLTAGENTAGDGDTYVMTTMCGGDTGVKETRDMHFYLVGTEGVDAFAEGYYSATYSASSSYSIAYGTQNGKTGLYIQDGGVSGVMSLIYSGDGWYRVTIGTGDKVLTSDGSGNLSEAVWAGRDAQLWRFERSDGTPLTAETAGISGEADGNNISDDGTPGVYAGTARFTARLVNKEGMALAAPVDSIDRTLSFTSAEFLQAVARVYTTAHNNNYLYGSSSSAVPCADGIISCDRLIARAVYDLGLTDQPVGGITLGNMTAYLQRYGFVTFTDISTAQAGDIMMVADASGSIVHTFVVESYNSGTGMCTKYDLGSQSRIDAMQPLSTALDEWSEKDISYGIRDPYSKAPAYEIITSAVSDSTSELWIFEK